jgi:excinuclease ABC subunit A
VTEIYDYLRLLFARAGIPHCPICGREVARQSAQEIVEEIERLPEGARLLILSPLVRGRKGTHQAVLDEIRKAGFVRARVDGIVHELEEDVQMDRYKIHTIEAVVDRLVARYDDDTARDAARSRLTELGRNRRSSWRGYLTVHSCPPSPRREAKSKPWPEEDPRATTCTSPSTWPAPSTAQCCPRSSRAPSPSTPPHGACPTARAWAASWRSIELLIPDRDVLAQ